MGKFIDTLTNQLGGAIGGIVNTGLGLALEGHEDKRQLNQQQKLQNLQIAGSKELTDYNYQKQLDMWHSTNYGAQMEELKKSGLNAGLIYGMSGGGATTTGSGSGSVTGAHAPVGGGEIMGIMQMRNMEAQNEVLKSQAELNRTQAKNIGEGGIDTKVKETSIEQMIAETKNTKAQTALTNIQTGIADLQKTIIDSTQMDQIRLIDMAAQKAQSELNIIKQQEDITNETKDAMIGKSRQEYLNAIIQGNLMKSNIKVNAAEINKMSQDILQRAQELQLRGKEINIKSFEATIRANYPSLEDTAGSMLNSIKRFLDKTFGLNDNYVYPNQIK